MGPIIDRLQSRLVASVQDDANSDASDYASILEDLPPQLLPKADAIVDLIKQKLSKEPVDDRSLLVCCIERHSPGIVNLPCLRCRLNVRSESLRISRSNQRPARR